MQTGETIEVFLNEPAQRARDKRYYRGGRHEDRNHLTTPHRRIPVGEIQNDTWEEACLEDAEQNRTT